MRDHQCRDKLEPESLESTTSNKQSKVRQIHSTRHVFSLRSSIFPDNVNICTSHPLLVLGKEDENHILPAMAYRKISPTSPLSPRSPTGSVPQWLLSRKSRAGLLSRARVKLILIAAACILLGWMMTSSLSLREEIVEMESSPYDIASAGVLSNPSGFGTTVDSEGVKGDNEGWEDLGEEKTPSVSGALSELHHAVSDKLKAWAPYRPAPGLRVNKTANSKGLNKPTLAKLGGEDVMEGLSEAERLGARTRIGKCTILFNGNSFWERAIRTHEQHDKLHGYRLHVLRTQLMDDVWSKPAYILSLLLRELAKPENDRLEWLFWVDADTIILNPHIPIEVFLPPPGPEFDTTHLLYSNDWNGLNNGVFPVRVNQWSVQLFSAITSFRHYRPDESLVFRDQSAMNTLMQEPEFAKSVVQAPQRWFNAYQGEHNETLAPFQVRRGDLLVHFAGVGNREERMGYWLDRAEQHLEDWEVPVKSTSYPQEARDFWDQQRDHRKNRISFLAETRLKATELLDLTDQRMTDFGERLPSEQLDTIKLAREALAAVLNDAKFSDDAPKCIEYTTKLEEASQPLLAAIGSAHKTLLSTAHEAIFGGEKDLLDNNFEAHPDDAALQNINERVKSLKNLVITPEELWNRAEITAATNVLTEATAALHETKAAAVVTMLQQEAAAKKAELEVATKAKALEEARKQVLAEADAALAAPTPVLGDPPAFVAVVTVPGAVVTVTPGAAIATPREVRR